MCKFAEDPTLEAKMHQYQIVGRAAPTPKNPKPKVYRMRIFARNAVLAKSRFWHFMKQLNKAKKSGGELLAVNELHDASPTKVKNYGVWLRYQSRTNTHNMYKEFRNVNINGAIGQLYQEMSGRHRAEPGSIQILHAAAVPDAECRREHVTEMHGRKLKFPVIRRRPHAVKKLRTTFKAKRPQTFVR
mmetsp:Transcript_61509/g.144079  ORF Transcript_61509/g.144079 Transcript_61509/m.144079 type:complete len:187 (+) Transcript_61509:62-622(+)